MFKQNGSIKSQPHRSFKQQSDVLTIDQLVHQDDWVCDSERYRCHVCTRNFNHFRRKHHCRRCGEVVCRNCTLYKEAELPVIGRSRVRVCMSCILSHVNGQVNPQSPPAASRSSSTSDGDSRWVAHHLHSPTTGSDHDNEYEMNRASMMTDFDYPLDFNWEHPWPKPPLIPNEQARLDALYSFDILDTPAEDVFDIICDLASNALKCPIAAVSLIDEDRQWFKASAGLAQNEIPRNVSFCAHAIMSKEPLVVMDTTTDRRFQKNPLVTGAAGIRFYAGAPICTQQGYILGTVFVFDTQPRDSCDIATLEKLSNVAMKNMEDRKNAVAAPVDHARSVNYSNDSMYSHHPPQSPYSQPSGTHSNSQVSMAVQSTYINPPVSSSNAMVSQQNALSSQSHANTDGSIVTGPKMETMLMDLLCRTTETQQQLATQQGAMFQTLGQHTAQIDKLADAVARMEARLATRETSGSASSDENMASSA